MPDLESYRALIVDLDGVLWVGETPAEGLHGFFACLRRRGLRFLLVSNNATASPESVTEASADGG
jgi:4-nitrophenyl phosphatase